MNREQRIVKAAMLVAEIEGRIERAEQLLPGLALDSGNPDKARCLLENQSEEIEGLRIARAALRGACAEFKAEAAR